MSEMVKGFFITGTDTEVGKTHVSTQLIKGFSERAVTVSGYKPVASGAELVKGRWVNEDALSLMHYASVQMPYGTVNPYCFEPAIAPHLAAKRAGIEIELDTIKSNFLKHVEHADVVIVEGAGGWKVPLGDDLGFEEVPKELALPVVLVVGLKLGCINHALLTEQAILSSGCQLVGWVANCIDSEFEEIEENILTLKNKMRFPCIGILQHHVYEPVKPHITDSNIETTLDYLMNFG